MKPSAQDIVARLKLATGAANDTELARRLGVSSGAVVSNWQHRNTVPLSQCVDVAQASGVSLDWLILGRGPRQSAGHGNGGCRDNQAEYSGMAGEDGAGDERWSRVEPWAAWVREWWSSATDEERIWLEVQLLRAFPDYAVWLSRQSRRATANVHAK